MGLCLIGLTLGSLVGALALAAPDQKPQEQGVERWEKDIAAFERWDSKNTPARDAILFAGSSSIRMWPTATAFPELTVINRGFGGSQISDVNHYFDRLVLPYKPPVIVFYCGDNDIASNKTPQRVAEDYRTFIALVHAKLPKTHVIYLPIKPSVSRWKLWPQMREANDLIRQFCDSDPRLVYVDTATPMLGDDGKPRADLLLDDGLHLNEKGYAIWNEARPPRDRQSTRCNQAQRSGRRIERPEKPPRVPLLLSSAASERQPASEVSGVFASRPPFRNRDGFGLRARHCSRAAAPGVVRRDD